jgi:hypothetical protein
MAAGTTPIFPATPYSVSMSLIAAAACTTRAPTATAGLAAAAILAFVPVSTNGLRVDRIQVKAAATAITGATTAATVVIWQWDGTTAWPVDEILITVVTPSTSVASGVWTNTYTNFVLPSTFALYASGTVIGAAAAHALIVTAYGGAY